MQAVRLMHNTYNKKAKKFICTNIVNTFDKLISVMYLPNAVRATQPFLHKGGGG